MDPADLNALDARRLMLAGELSSTELLEACLRRTDAVNPTVNAIVARNDDEARRLATEADAAQTRGETTGPLHGLPVAIKDLQATAGIRTTYGSPAFADNVPSEDAGIVSRIRAAGGIIIGKTNIPERSIGANTVNPLHGATGNPFDPTLSCGGSSGGSAVALATGMAPLATGSDHGGSIRIPACWCGVVGHRATPGVVPNEERTMTQNFYSVQGPMARTVSDTALLLSVVADRTTGRHPHDPMMFPLNATELAELEPPEPGSLKIAVSADLGGVLVSNDIRQVFESRVERLGDLVGEVVRHDVDLSAAPSLDWRIRSDIFVTQYHEEADRWTDEFNPNIRQSYDAAVSMSMEDIARARRQQMALHHDLQRVFETYDALVCPGVSITPFPWTQRNPTEIDGTPVENYMAWLGLTSSLSVVGHPVTAIPCGQDSNGMPFGIQIVGPMYQDRRVLGIASALEAAFAADDALARPRPVHPV